MNAYSMRGNFARFMSDIWFGLIGTATSPVLGCTQNGVLSRWFIPVETWTSRRGYVRCRT